MYYICLDIGGTSVKTAVTNEKGNIFAQKPCAGVMATLLFCFLAAAKAK